MNPGILQTGSWSQNRNLNPSLKALLPMKLRSSFINCPFRDFLKLQAPRSNQQETSSACCLRRIHPYSHSFQCGDVCWLPSDDYETFKSLNSALLVFCVKESEVKLVFSMTLALFKSLSTEGCPFVTWHIAHICC